jgi:hypothetical protein
MRLIARSVSGRRMILAAEHISGTTDIVIPVLEMLPSFQSLVIGRPPA